MTLTKKLAFSFAATTSIFSLGSVAIAGEGGSATAAAFSVENGVITGVTQAAAIGKNNAAAAAFNNGIDSFNSAYALGSTGAMTLSNIADATNANIQGGAEPNLGIAQVNGLTGGISVKIGTGIGDTLINLP